MNKLKEYREQFKLSQREVAAKMDLSQGQYWKLETGRSLLNSKQILQLCAIYECTPNDILGVQGVHTVVLASIDKQ